VTDDVRNRTALVAMAGALAHLDTAVAQLERAQRDAARALPAGHDLLYTFDRIMPDVRVLQRKAEHALGRVPSGAPAGASAPARMVPR